MARTMEQESVGRHYHRVAVLPLVNISPNNADSYFADGLTEELISTLSKIAAFRVISRTSVMRFKGESLKSATEIGKELGVGNLVEGSVRKIGNKNTRVCPAGRLSKRRTGLES